MAGSEGLGPGLHASMLSQMLGSLIPGTQNRLQLGNADPAG